MPNTDGSVAQNATTTTPAPATPPAEAPPARSVHEQVADQLSPTPAAAVGAQTGEPVAPPATPPATPEPAAPATGGTVQISEQELNSYKQQQDALTKLANYTQQLEYAYSQELQKLQGGAAAATPEQKADAAAAAKETVDGEGTQQTQDALFTMKTGEQVFKTWIKDVLNENTQQQTLQDEKTGIEQAIPQYYELNEQPNIVIPRVRYLAEAIVDQGKQQGRIIPWNYAYAEAMKGFGALKQAPATGTQNANAPVGSTPTGQGQPGAPAPAQQQTEAPKVPGMQGTPDSTSQVPPQNTGQTALQLKEAEVAQLKTVAEKPNASELEIRKWMQSKRELRTLYSANK